MTDRLRIDYLANHPEALLVLKGWFEREWAGYYGPDGPGNAEQDLLLYSSRTQLPIGLVAYCAGELCGVAALKADSIRSRPELGPWAAAGLVLPSLRRKGIGAQLIAGLEEVAKRLGYSTIYCGTGTAASLLQRCGWQY